MTEKPVHITAKVYITRPDGLILALHRSASRKKRPLTWDLPEGKADYGVDPNKALLRETLEETGITLTDTRIHSITGQGEDEYRIYLLYTANLDHQADIHLSEKHDDFKWITSAEFQRLSVPSRYKNSIANSPQS